MAAKKANELKAKFKFTRSTKGTHVYSEVDDKGEEVRNLIGSVYVQRAAMSEAVPELTITITF